MRAASKLIRHALASPLLRRAGLYTISNLAAKAIPFLLLPVLTRYLTPADYGVVAMFLMMTTVLDPFVSLALPGAVTVKYFDKNVELGAFIGTGTLVVLAAAAPLAVAIAVLRDPLSDLVAVPANWLPLVIVLIVSRMFASLALNLWLVQERPIVFGLFQNLQSAGIIGASLLLVVAWEMHWQGRVMAELVVVGVTGAGALVYLVRAGWLRMTYVRDHARSLLHFGIPLIPHTLGSVLMVQTDRMFITHMVGVDETGLYTVGFQLALVIELVASSFNNAYTPWLFKKLVGADDAMKARLVRMTYLQFAAMWLFALAVALIMPPFATHVLGDQFAGSAAYVRWFAIAFASSGMYYMVTNYIFFVERTSWLALVTLLSAAINIPLSYLLIRANGAVGAAQATALAMVIRFVLTWVVSARVYPLPWFRPFLTPTDPRSKPAP